MKSGFFGFVGSFLTLASAEVIDDSFDVSDVGYVPWAGQKKVFLASGPYKQFQQGPLMNAFALPGITVVQEPGNDQWSTLAFLELNAGFRNNWGCDACADYGPYYEADTNYTYRDINCSVWGNLLGQYINFGGWYGYAFNYQQWYPAYQASGWFTYAYSIIEQMSVGVNSNAWIQWDDANTVIETWERVRPRIDIRINADMSLGVFCEFVMMTPETELEETELRSVRPGMLVSWNFRPKSWLYFALNDYRVQISSGTLQSQYQIAAVKVKYLIYF
jgi:hypothetical protein